MTQKPSLAKGTRDFLPDQVRKRKYIFQIIEECFQRFAYQPLETPAMENLSTLTGKYGDEGDKLLFKILNSGDYLKDAKEELLLKKDSNALIPMLSEKGLRYDLTVPLARTVVMNQHLITFPFKRYQIQAVWRADRPQKGRYREFYQCDADVIGSSSLMYEAELIMIYQIVFKRLGIKVKIVYNHRNILEGLAIFGGREDLFMPLTMSLDKLDKIGVEAVCTEVIEMGFERSKAEEILQLVQRKNLSDFQFNDKTANGILELNTILNYLEAAGYDKETLCFDPSLARGLSYYTGTIFEVIPMDAKMGSLGGGGRYDNLTGVFGLNGVSGVGISFGAERIFDVMEESKLFPENLNQYIKVLFMVLDEPNHPYAFQIVNKLRSEGITAELYPEPGKLKKPFKYAEDLKAENIVVIGENEVKTGQFSLKNQQNGEQIEYSVEGLINKLKNS